MRWRRQIVLEEQLTKCCEAAKLPNGNSSLTRLKVSPDFVVSLLRTCVQSNRENQQLRDQIRRSENLDTPPAASKDSLLISLQRDSFMRKAEASEAECQLLRELINNVYMETRRMSDRGPTQVLICITNLILMAKQRGDIKL
jgi:hypothetical protein